MLKITAKCGKLPANHKTIRPFDYMDIRPTNLKNYYVGKKIILTNVDIMTRSKNYYKIYIKDIYIHIAIDLFRIRYANAVKAMHHHFVIRRGNIYVCTACF